jgi:trans-aconitate 2-methyltransferase
MATWDPKAYGRFAAERRRPVDDLIGRLPRPDYVRIADLGCGAAASTAALAERFPSADIYGLDSSAAMISSARRVLPDREFRVEDIADWRDPRADLAFSNAALQWAPDHVAIMARIASELPAGGALAAQFPDNLDEPSHALMREIAALPAFRDKLASQAGERQTIGGFADYEQALAPHCGHIDIWRTVYAHRLEGPEAIVAWVEGAGLRPFLAPLTEAEKADYLAAYQHEIAKAYPRQPSGAVLLAFPRLFVVAAR